MWRHRHCDRLPSHRVMSWKILFPTDESLFFFNQNLIFCFRYFCFGCRPDISALRERGVLGNTGAPATLSVNPVNPYQGPALEDLEAPKRQTSLDGEAIKIVIHDVDSGPLCASKRRVVLRKDPNDKAHRSEIYICLHIYYLIDDLI